MDFSRKSSGKQVVSDAAEPVATCPVDPFGPAPNAATSAAPAAPIDRVSGTGHTATVPQTAAAPAPPPCMVPDLELVPADGDMLSTSETIPSKPPAPIATLPVPECLEMATRDRTRHRCPGYDANNPPPKVAPCTAPQTPVVASYADDPEWLDLLEGGIQTKPNGWMACCPAHVDSSPSLSIDLRDGRYLVCCHAGCDQSDLLDSMEALGIQKSDLFLKTEPAAAEPVKRVVANYSYKDAQGVERYQVVRYAPKEFRQRRSDGTAFGWTWNMQGVPRILYRIPEILAADSSQWVFVVEGEKDVDNLTAAGFVATCSSGGAGKWSKLSDIGPLQGRRVAIIPDADEPGRAHAAEVAWTLKDVAAEIRIVGLSVKDVSDWFAAGNNPATLLEMVDAAEEYIAPDTAPGPPSGQDGSAAPSPDEGAVAETELIDKVLTEPINIQTYYDHSPALVRRLTELLVHRCPTIDPAIAYFASWSMINGALGKQVSITNMGHELYPAFWFVGLVPSGLGKSTIPKAARAITSVIRARRGVAPFRFLGNKFTMSSLMSDYGEGVADSAWAGLDDAERFLKQDELEQKCVRKAGRLMINAEFGQYFGSILRSGIEGGEAGSVLELADSGSHIDAHTKSSGVRFIHDACVGICGLSQPKVWYDNFDPDANIDTGLAGRFLLAEQGDYVLTVQTLELTEQETFNAISDVFREVLNRTRGLGNRIAHRVRCEVEDLADERGQIFEDLMRTPALAAIKKHGFLDVEKLKGKLIMLALKLTVSHCFLGASQELINSLTGTAVAEGGPPPVPVRANPCAMDDDSQPEQIELLARCETAELYDTNVYRDYLDMVVMAACRAYNSKARSGAVRMVQEKVIKRLKRAKGGKIFQSKLLDMGLKIDKRRLSARDIDSYIVGPLTEQGVIATEEGPRGGVTIRWTGQEVET